MGVPRKMHRLQIEKITIDPSSGNMMSAIVLGAEVFLGNPLEKILRLEMTEDTIVRHQTEITCLYLEELIRTGFQGRQIRALAALLAEVNARHPHESVGTHL